MCRSSTVCGPSLNGSLSLSFGGSPSIQDLEAKATCRCHMGSSTLGSWHAAKPLGAVGGGANPRGILEPEVQGGTYGFTWKAK